jgi:quercetin dioxygenase-like cupin family protein
MAEKLIPFPEIQQPVPKVTLWEGPGRLDLERLRELLAAEGYMAVKWASEPNQVYVPHAHIYTELVWLATGSLTVILPAHRRILELNPGDRVEVPAGTLHASQAGPEGAVYLAATR